MELAQLDQYLTDLLFLKSSGSGQTSLYVVASAFVYLVPIVLLWLFFFNLKARLTSIKTALTGLLAWQVFSQLSGHFLYNQYGFRDRPFGQLGIPELFLEQPEKAFPSDHAAFLMAVAGSFFVSGYRQFGWFFLIGGVISSLARIMIGFHFVGDVLAGWLLAGVAVLALKVIDKPLTKWLNKLVRPIEKVMDGFIALAKK